MPERKLSKNITITKLSNQSSANQKLDILYQSLKLDHQIILYEMLQ